MNTPREKLTLGWRPKDSRKIARGAEYVEVRPAAYVAPAAATATKNNSPDIPVAKCKPIRDRLENWARSERGIEAGMGRGGADCMTGVVCQRLRRAALGDVWSGTSVPIEIDERDAKLVAEAWKSMPSLRFKFLLRWHYIYRAKPEAICRRFEIKLRPASVFQLELARAEDAIENLLDSMQSGAKILSNNLLPSNATRDSTVGVVRPEETESLD